MNEVLKRFLPRIHSGSDGPNRAGDSLERLQQLRQNLIPYVPPEVVARELLGAAPPPTCDLRSASLLFADISGFTALSERLAALGREGTEQLTAAINQYFYAMLAILEPYQGSTLKFGGDALVVAFYQPDHARAAASAALALQQQMGGWQVQTVLGAAPLRLAIGLGSGELLLMRLGTEQRREIVLLGGAAREIALAEEIATAGEIVAGPTMAAALPPAWLARQDDRVAWLDLATPPDPPARTGRDGQELAPIPVEQLGDQLVRLAAYLPEGLLERLILDPSNRLEGEHRIVTVLFANIIGLPACPPTGEGVAAMSRVLQEHFLAMQAAVARYGGAVNKIDVASEGYTLMALFGAPVTHEDDEERAVLAALAMRQGMAELNQRASEQLGMPVTMEQRVGIHSGVVFAGNIGSELRREYSVMGDHVNLAARLMQQAQPGTILISASTRDLISPVAPVVELPPVRVKGKREPVRIFLVEGWRRASVDVVARRASLVGRTGEMESLRQALTSVSQQQGRAIFLHGEAGVGKSRLVAELLSEAADFLLLEGRCLSYGSGIPYHPWRSVLERMLQVDENETPEVQRAQAQRGMEALLPDQMDLFPLLGPILGIDIPHTTTTARLTPELRHQRLLALVGDLLVAMAAWQPMLVIDDVHWIDAASADLLAYVTRQIESQSILILMMGRVPPGEQFAGQGGDLPLLPFFSVLTVEELPAEAGLLLARSLLAERGLPAEAQELVLQRSGGNPLYIEELVDALADEAREVPDTLQGLIMSRLDRLAGPQRRAIQVASVVGHRFDALTLEGVYPYEDRQLVSFPARLADLEQRRMITIERHDPSPVYQFRHMLTHEVAYESLPFVRRRELHQRVGEYLESSLSEGSDERHGLLSYHYYRAQKWRRALHYTLLAADRAKENYANEAAITLYRRALEVLQQLEPADPHRFIQVCQSLGNVYGLVGRYDEAMEIYGQALEVAAEPEARIQLLEGQARVLEQKGELSAALECLDGAKALVGEGAESSLALGRLESQYGWVEYLAGNYTVALETVNRAIGWLDHFDRSDPRVSALLAPALYYLGAIHTRLDNLDEALGYDEQSLALYRELKDSRGIAYTYNSIAELYWLQDDVQQAMEALSASLAVQREVGDAFGLAAGLNNLGILYFHAGQLEEAEVTYLDSLQLARRIGMRYLVGQLLCNLAELSIERNRDDAAVEYINEAEPIATEVGDRDTLNDLEKYRGIVTGRRAEPGRPTMVQNEGLS